MSKKERNIDHGRYRLGVILQGQIKRTYYSLEGKNANQEKIAKSYKKLENLATGFKDEGKLICGRIWCTATGQELQRF